jgi:death-on-curing protein
VSGPIWIDLRNALTLHDLLVALHGGANGLRSEGLLLSALARPQQHFADAESPHVIDTASAYTSGIVRDHPFVDGIRAWNSVPGA